MEVLARLALAQAARLARRGAYASAEAALERAGCAGPRADLLDLKARVRAQQGRWAEAEALWREALSLDPGNEEVRAALALLARPSRGRSWLTAVAVRAAVVAAVLLLAWTALAQRREVGRLRAGLAQEERTAPSPPPALEAAAAGGSADVPASLGPIRAALEPLPGISLTERDGTVEVRFDEGLFPEAAVLRSDAPALVSRLAEALASLEVACAVEVHGHTDSVPVRDGSPYASNRSLGLARASAVADILLGDGRRSSIAISVHAHGPEAPPYPGDAGGLRNRTVTLRITPLAREST